MKRVNRNPFLVGGSIFVVGVVLGMVAGTISGILFAPQSGEDTREYLRTQADELGEAITGTGQDIIETGRRQVSTVLQQGHEAVDHARAAVKSVNTKVA